MRFRVTARHCLMVAGLVTGALAVAPVAYAAPAAPAQPGQVQIKTFADSCVDVEGGSPADLTDIIQYHCTGAYNQRFRITYVGYGQVEIKTFADSCLDVEGGSPADFTNIIQYHCTGGYNQRFSIVG
jgi:hypothetical protein